MGGALKGPARPSPAARWTVAAVLVFLVVLLIPWYWPAERVEPFIMGLPVWAFVSYLLSAAFAVVIVLGIHFLWGDDDA